MNIYCECGNNLKWFEKHGLKHVPVCQRCLLTERLAHLKAAKTICLGNIIAVQDMLLRIAEKEAEK